MDNAGMSFDSTKNKLAQLLLKFIKRASEPGATPDELAALPNVARVLGELLTDSF